MKKIIISVVLALSFFGFLGFNLSQVDAVTHVKGYTTKKGTYVAPHYRSDRDSLKSNNYSSKGNYNPYTGKKGSKNW